MAVHLYADSVPECDIMNDILSRLAPKFPYVKFLKIKSGEAVENWPLRNLPTLFVYTEGELKHQMLTLHELGSTDATPDGMTLITKFLTYLWL